MYIGKFALKSSEQVRKREESTQPIQPISICKPEAVADVAMKEPANCNPFPSIDDILDRLTNDRKIVAIGPKSQ